MLFHHNDPRRDIRTLTDSRVIDATPRHLARALQHQNLFRPPAANPQRPSLIAIDFDAAPGGRGAVTIHCPCGGISERRPLWTRHASPARLAADTGSNVVFSGTTEPPALALTIDVTPFVQPGPAIAIRVTLSFHFVHQPWWPSYLTDALGDLADLWLKRLDEQALAMVQDHRTQRTR